MQCLSSNAAKSIAVFGLLLLRSVCCGLLHGIELILNERIRGSDLQRSFKIIDSFLLVLEALLSESTSIQRLCLVGVLDAGNDKHVRGRLLCGVEFLELDLHESTVAVKGDL